MSLDESKFESLELITEFLHYNENDEQWRTSNPYAIVT